MAIDLKEYFTSLAKDAGWDEATQQTILKAIENDKVSKKLGDELMTRPDYSRAQDELRKQTEAFEQQKSAWQEWYKTADAAVRDQQAKSVQAIAQLNAYKETFGDLSGTDAAAKAAAAAAAQTFDPTQLQAQLTQQFQQMQQRLLGTVVDTAKVQGEYFQTFNKPMSPVEVDELTKLATSQNRPLLDVYRDFVAPKLAEKQTADWEAKTQNRVSEAVKDALSKHQIPVDAAPKGTSSFLSRVQEAQKTANNPRTEAERRASFVEAYNGAATGAAK